MSFHGFLEIWSTYSALLWYVSTNSVFVLNNFLWGKERKLLQLWDSDRLRLRLIYLNDIFDESLRVTVTPYSGSLHHAQTSTFWETFSCPRQKSSPLEAGCSSTDSIVGVSVVWSSMYAHQVPIAKWDETQSQRLAQSYISIRIADQRAVVWHDPTRLFTVIPPQQTPCQCSRIKPTGDACKVSPHR